MSGGAGVFGGGYSDRGSGADPGGSEFAVPEIARDAPRPSAILKVADAFEASGGQILELFREVSSPVGSAVFPIHLTKDDRTFYIEVETGEWVRPVVEGVISRAAILRSSSEYDAEMRVLSAYPVPEAVSYLTGKSSGALLQLDLYGASLERPEEAAESFRKSAGRRWQSDLEYATGYLPLVEQLTLASLDDGGRKVGVLDQLVWGLGCFLGETLRRSEAGKRGLGSWRTGRDSDWAEGASLEFTQFTLDPVGKARAFLENGAEDSISFYADYVLRELEGESR